MNLLATLVVLAQIDAASGEEEEATAPPASPPPPIVEHVVAAPPKASPPVSLRFDGAYASRKLFSLSVTGADLGLGILVQPSPHMGVGGSVRGFIGGTEHGLRVWDVRVMGETEVIAFDRLHLGSGIGLFLLGVERAARDETIRSWGPQMQGHARFDIVRDDYAIFVRGALSGGYDLYDSSFFWGPSIGAGFELDIAGRRNR